MPEDLIEDVARKLAQLTEDENADVRNQAKRILEI